jgi:hypothetical protein
VHLRIQVLVAARRREDYPRSVAPKKTNLKQKNLVFGKQMDMMVTQGMRKS